VDQQRTGFDEHLQRLRAQAPDCATVAFFDLDRTVVAGYTVSAFVYEQARQGLLSGSRLARQALNYARFGRGSIDFAQLIGAAAADFAGIGVREAEAFAQDVFERHTGVAVYREAEALIAAHRALGHRLVMVTSATQFQSEPVARALGFDELRCTRIASHRGILSGTLQGAPCFGMGKLRAGRAVARRNGSTLERAWFYTDSADDLPLLRRVGNPVAVNPQPALLQEAQQQHWPVLNFSSRAEPTLSGTLRTGLACNAVLGAAAAGAAAYVSTGSSRLARNRMTEVLGELGIGLAGLDLEVSGGHYLEQQRPAVFIFNHQSYVDGLVLASLLRHDLTAFCKRELASVPLLGTFMQAAGAIFVDREDAGSAREPLQRGMAALRAGSSVAVAPEGTRGNGNSLAPFKHGAFVLARRAKVPVVPLVLHNTGDALPRGSFQLRSITLRVTVLPPLDVASWGARQFSRRIEELEQQYRELLRYRA
jgi:putative phosphoserine phosphatase / 1-acylglycerol-3-phosphate O-acyltransferase